MRDNIWYSLVDVKFRAIYLDECSRLANLIGQVYTIFLAFVASSSVATWAVWKEYPTIWAIIVGISQLLHIMKSYVPFIKRGSDYRDMSNEFESLYLRFEKLWYKLEQRSIDYNEKTQEEFYTLREEELDIFKRHKEHPPRFKWLITKSRKEIDNTLRRFLKGENHV